MSCRHGSSFVWAHRLFLCNHLHVFVCIRCNDSVSGCARRHLAFGPAAAARPGLGPEEGGRGAVRVFRSGAAYMSEVRWREREGEKYKHHFLVITNKYII